MIPECALKKKGFNIGDVRFSAGIEGGLDNFNECEAKKLSLHEMHNSSQAGLSTGTAIVFEASVLWVNEMHNSRKCTFGRVKPRVPFEGSEALGASVPNPLEFFYLFFICTDAHSTLHHLYVVKL